MVERAAINEGTQIGVETTYGTAVPADLLLPSISIEPAVKTSNNLFKTAGYKLPTISSLGKEWSEWSIKSDAPTYDELTYLLNSILVTAAPVQEGSTTAYTSTFSPAGSQPDAVTSFTVGQGSSVRAMKATGLLVSDLSLDWDRDKIA